MSRIRSIHPGLWTDEAFVSLGMPARLFSMGLWTEADDQGVFEWSPLKLKMRIAPADNCDAAALLSEIAGAGLIAEFESGGRRYGAIRNFQKYQRPKQPQLRFPLPDELIAFVAQPEAADEKPVRGTALGKMLCEAQGGKCFYCAEEVTFYRKKATSCEVDHKIPVSRGGEDDVANLVAACKPCNSLKGSMTYEEFQAQFSPEFLATNCREKSRSQSANGKSQSANSDFALCDSGPKKRMEDGGWRREKEDKPGGSSSLTRERAKFRAPSKTRLADDWFPAEWALGTKCRKIVDSWPPGELEFQVEKFHASHTSRGSMFDDWQAAWKTWVLNSVEFRGKNDRTSHSPHAPRDTRDGLTRLLHEQAGLGPAAEHPSQVDGRSAGDGGGDRLPPPARLAANR